jgi:hypothetical protein
MIMLKKYALLSSQGTACAETVLVGAHYTVDQRDRIEASIDSRNPDAPIPGTWTDVTDNEACGCGCSFDEAQEAFRDHPTATSAADYQNAADEYHSDGMIGDDTFNAALDEIEVWVKADLADRAAFDATIEQALATGRAP